MAAVYSTAFIKSHGGAGGSYTVPDGFIAIVRCVTGFNASVGLPEDAQVFLGHSSVTIWQYTLTPYDPSSPGFYATDELRVVVEATDTINVSSGLDVDMTVSGYLLSTP